MGIPLEQGRTFDLHDSADAPAVAVVNRALARVLFPREEVLESTVTPLGGDDSSRRIVGVVADVRSDSQPPDPQPTIFVPLAQDPVATSMGWAVHVRHGDPYALVPAVKDAVRQVDAGMPVYLVNTLEVLVANIDFRPRFLMSLLGAFATLALVLAATGIYAVLAYAVSQRQREIGVRMALGAQRGQVLSLILKGGLGLAAVGIALGFVGALGFSRLLSSQLYGVTASDPTTYLTVAAVLLTVAAAASLLPAWRAARVDPVKTLRR